MGIGVEHTKDKLQGDGVTTTFPFSFPVTGKEQVKCIKVLSSGEEILILNTEYTVKVNEIGGEVTYPLIGEALQEDEYILIYRSTAIKQDYSPDNGNTFDALVIRKEIDRLTMIAQELQEQLNRAVKTTMSSNISPDSYLEEINTLLNNARLFYEQSIKTCQKTLTKSQENADLCERDAQAVAEALAAIKKIAADFDAVVEKATAEFNNLKDSNIAEFNLNCETSTAAYNQNAESRLKSYNDNHNDKLLIIENKVEASTTQANRAKAEADRAEVAADNAEIQPDSGCQNLIDMDSSVIRYQDSVTRYRRNVIAGDVFTIDLSQRRQIGNCITLELILRMPNVVSFSLAQILPLGAGETTDSNKKWLNGSSPDFSEAGEHWVVLFSVDNGVTWRGTYEGKFNI